MCGIAGFLGAWSADDLERMKRSLHHRGPDEASVHLDPAAGLGLAHTRLSIIDVAGGQQPLFNEDGSLVVIFNGELYNHLELRAELEGKGHRLAKKSDGEVIAHLYEEEGPAFVARLRGMYAIALWDGRRKQLHLFRDRFGIKPLYYRQTSRGILFASEIKALLAVERVRDIDPQAMEWYLSFRYVPEDRTMFAGIRKLMPGHRLAFAGAEVEVERYWDLRAIDPLPDRAEAEWIDELRDQLRESVKIRLMSEVPLGSFLSGGLDSSFIVGLMSQVMDRPVETFAFGVADGWHDESDYAQIVADAFRTSHHPLRGDCDDPGLLQEITWFLDEPLGDAAIMPTYMLSKLTREFVTVVLTGEGADELLGGYDKYKALARGDGISRFVPRPAFHVLAALLPATSKWYRAARFMATAADRARAYIELVAVFCDAEKRALLDPSLRRRMAGGEPAAGVIGRVLAGCHSPDYLDQLMHIDVATWLPNDVLLKADRMTMAHSLEGRVPFLDHVFAEFCARMPGSLKMKNWREKHVLREAMRGLVPDRIVERRKHGFTVPMEAWARGGPQSPIAHYLSPQSVKRRGWFDPAVVARLLRSNIKSEYTRRKIFALVALEAWARVFLDADRLEAPRRDPIARTSPQKA